MTRNRVVAGMVAATAVLTVGLGFTNSADAEPYNTGLTISGCTYCHTGHIPPVPGTTTPVPSTVLGTTIVTGSTVPSSTTVPGSTTTTQRQPEDEGSDGFAGIGGR